MLRRDRTARVELGFSRRSAVFGDRWQLSCSHPNSALPCLRVSFRLEPQPTQLTSPFANGFFRSVRRVPERSQRTKTYAYSKIPPTHQLAVEIEYQEHQVCLALQSVGRGMGAF